ncbi:DUF4232 domain-containing protein [Streptomyces sp. NBC_00083]|uniref:DUF4232 domain-containing protein n=1 Tax=Streptomyces sp. NBC_00083 TaxID=2975647 RepID=UPI0022560C70|nr:DUF4232 domain-containing protein [Streptomyces sp. NBC_00083]MCX5381743.1 DUF4232 domain-containing protein [Streptomyces sp. NBC_00083]
MRVRKLTFAALAVAAGLSLTACQSDDGSTQSDPPAASNAPSTGGGSASGSGTGSDQGSDKSTGGSGGKATTAGTGSSGSGGAGSAKGVAKCRTLDLNITAADATVGGDAERTVAVEFMNSSGHDCMVSGFAGVDLKTNAGTVSAKRTGAAATPYTLKHGKSVFFGITYPANDSGGSGARITGLVVTPPGETKSATLPWPGAASLPVTESGGAQVKVGPMGSAGQGG